MNEHTRGKRKEMNERGAKKEAKKRVNLFENHFISRGEENERQMANNVMQEMRVL